MKQIKHINIYKTENYLYSTDRNVMRTMQSPLYNYSYIMKVLLFCICVCVFKALIVVFRKIVFWLVLRTNIVSTKNMIEKMLASPQTISTESCSCFYHLYIRISISFAIV